MALIRTKTVWTGSAGAPYYTENYWQGDADVAHANDAILALNAFFFTLAGYVTNTLSYTIDGDVDVIDISTGQITSVLAGTPVTFTGSASGEKLPPFTQGLLRMTTGLYLAGRQVRGRMFLPGMVETSNTAAGVPLTAMVTAIDAAGVTLAADSAGFSVYSRTRHAAATVTGATMWTQWASLRSRRD